MKKLLIGSVLAISSVLTVTGCTSVNATTDTTPATTTTTNMQKQHKAGMKDGMHKGGMRGPMSQLDLTATQQAQIKAIMQEKYSGNKKDRSKYQARSEEHTSELQSRENLVCRLLLEKKK